MKFSKTKINGAYLIELEKIEDERGFFARTWDSQLFKEFGLNNNINQCSISLTKKKGTIRGIHFQISPHEESKLVRCVQGKIFDVIVDLRSNSETFLQWYGVELSAENANSIYVPEGVAHGFQTLEDDSVMLYQISEFFHENSTRGIKWDDPKLSIVWPLKKTVISNRDNNLPYLKDDLVQNNFNL